ncbi:hypothetical protein [Microbispora sp. NBRC 16548]|uniref:hypothetical protein n=1 Tax=Microbispora sp. NBRC 16548 TaxID=3030994 RepID=UPI0017D544DF|nr:hypothetical protein [Microbispora sp. NBRC 16548]
MIVGIIATSITVRSRIASHGRVVVSIGVLLFAVGIVGMTVVIEAVQQPVPLIAAPLFVAGLGTGCCFGAVFAVALGDVNSARRHRGMRGEHPAASAPGSACPLSLPRFRRNAFAFTSVPITGVFP